MKNNRFLIIALALLTSLVNANARNDPHNAYIIFTPEITAKENTIKIAIKDNIDLAGYPTTAGSLAMVNNIAANDAFIVKQLKNSNYYLQGKTNLSEWANFRSEKSISGWSSYGGQTINTMGDNLNPCGSSSGSAVAVADGIVDISVGTETNGSISCPASVNGIVGFKPTVGLLSRSGIIPISPTQDTAGPMGRSVLSVARALEAMAGKDINDDATYLVPKNFNYDFTSDLAKNGIAGKRLGLLTSGKDDEDADELLKRIASLVNTLDGTVVQIEDNRTYPAAEEYFLLLYEFKESLESYLSNSASELKTIKSLIQFHNENAGLMMPYFQQEIFYKAQATAGKEDEYKKSLEMVSKVKKEFNELLDKYNLDGFVGLTRNPAWKIDNAGGDDAAMKNQKSFGNGAYAAIAGNPHITIPLAQINGLPVGISIMGPAWSDGLILQMAYDLELNKSSF